MPMTTEQYPWLTIQDDGTYDIDVKGCTHVTADRRLTIVQELMAGNVALPIGSVKEKD